MSRFAYAAAPNLNVVFFSDADITTLGDDAASACNDADLVVSLGNVDLERLGSLLPPNKPALCVLGGRDPERQPPAPFRVLHAGGVNFKDWRVAGLSGGKSSGVGNGFHIDEEEATSLLEKLPACDLFISNLPPAGLGRMSQGSEPGLHAITAYLQEKPPIYHFYGRQGASTVDDIINDIWIVGVNGMLYPEALRYL
jgi:hypothetical protein